MSFASDMADMANELLVDFGAPRVMYLVKEVPTGTASNPGPPTQTEYQITAVVKIKYFDSSEKGRLIDEHRREVIVSTKSPNGGDLAVSPISGYKLRFDGQYWNIDAVAPVSPGGEVIVYKLEVSR